MDVVDGARLAQDGRTAERPRYAWRFAVRDRDRYVLVNVADVEWIDAAANYVRLNTPRPRLPAADDDRARWSGASIPAQFTRIHRSTIVNTSRIREIKPDAHGDYDVVLIDGRTLRMSRTFRERVLGRDRDASRRREDRRTGGSLRSGYNEALLTSPFVGPGFSRAA